VLYLCIWLLGSPDTDIVSVHLATDVESEISLSTKPSSSIFNCIFSQNSRRSLCLLVQGPAPIASCTVYNIATYNTFHTVTFGMLSSFFGLASDLWGLRSNASCTLSMLSSDTRGRRGLLPLHKHPVSTNCSYRLVT
jgi:hypothetical protein